MKKQTKRVALCLLVILLAFLVVWGIALVYCEILTAQHKADFADAWQNNPMLEEPEYFKVLSCSADTARVYYVSQVDGAVLTFTKQDGTWVETDWETIWSKQGSASDVIWPYWWHFVYGGL